MAEWIGILNTTIKQYIREVEQNILRNRKVLALMRKKGRIQLNAGGGYKFNWRVRYKRHSMQGYADSDTLTFPAQDLWKEAELDWRGYAMTDSVTKKQKLMNRGKEAIVNRYTELTEIMMDDMEENFCDEMYIDGNLAQNSKKVHGIESFMGTTGSAITGTPVMNPSDSYAGLNTDLGSYGGSWTGTWPREGTGPTQYDFWSPLILDSTSTLAAASGGWSSSTKTYAANVLQILRYLFIHTKKNKSMNGQMDVYTSDTEMYRVFLEALSAKEQIWIERGTRKDGLLSMGYTDVVNFDGVDVTYEYGIPAGTAYGWNTMEMQLKSMQDRLFVMEDIDYDIVSKSDLFSIDFFGNYRYNPRYFGKVAAYGSNGT